MSKQYMKKIGIILAAFFLLPIVAFAQATYANLEEHVKRSENIYVCTVEEVHDNGSVTVGLDLILKGRLANTANIISKRGSNVPVSSLMRPGEKYLVFLSWGTVVTHPSRILKIEDDKVETKGIPGFKGGEYDEKMQSLALPLDQAVQQIRDLIPRKAPKPKPKRYTADITEIPFRGLVSLFIISLLALVLVVIFFFEGKASIKWKLINLCVLLFTFGIQYASFKMGAFSREPSIYKVAWWVALSLQIILAIGIGFYLTIGLSMPSDIWGHRRRKKVPRVWNKYIVIVIVVFLLVWLIRILFD